MSLQSGETAQFFLTSATPCPYLEGKQERKLFTHLSGRRAQSMHQLLSNNGFRRSQGLAYRPSCEDCAKCRSARVYVSRFTPNRRFRRILRTNRDLDIVVQGPEATDEQFELFTRYLASRHGGGGMTQMSEEDFQDMIEDTPVHTLIIEYRLPETSDEPGRLVAVSLTDGMNDGYSMVYSFFDPDLSRRSLGTFMILEHIARARHEGLPFVYLGYWVEDSPKMHYKADFAPLQIQSMHRGWVNLKPVPPSPSRNKTG